MILSSLSADARRTATGTLVLVLLALPVASMPWWAERSLLHLTAEFLCALALAQMWNLLVGYGGLVSVGQQLYLGVGAYCLVPFGLWLGINPFVVVLFAGLVCAVIATPAALLLFRLHGPYFAVGTWVLAEVVRLLVINNANLGGGSGLSILATVRGMPVWWRESATLWTALALGGGACLLTFVLLRSRLGLALTALRDSEAAAQSLGVNTRAMRWFVYVLCGGVTGMAGALMFTMKMRLSPDAAFSVDWSAMMFFIVVIGGIGSIEGPILGALVYFALRQWLSDYGVWYQLVLGASAIGFMLLSPKGIWGVIQRVVGASPLRTRRTSAHVATVRDPGEGAAIGSAPVGRHS